MEIVCIVGERNPSNIYHAVVGAELDQKELKTKGKIKY